MARYNSAIEVTFNANDGGACWRCNPESAGDVLRHHEIFGKWKTRWIFFKRFWKALMWMEGYVERDYRTRGCQGDTNLRKIKLWVFRPEIPE